MTPQEPFFQIGEICLVCATALEVENRPVSLTKISHQGVFLTVVHKECAAFVRLALQDSRLADNSLKWASYAIPLIEAERARREEETSRIAALRQSRAQVKLHRERSKLDERQRACEEAVERRRSALQSARIDVEQFPGPKSQEMLEQCEIELDAALARLQEVDARIAALPPTAAPTDTPAAPPIIPTP